MLKIKKLNLKCEELDFTDTQFMTKEEKLKIYKNFVSFLNNHFKESLFTKNLYTELTMHFGFIAHYNKNGFYSEYFESAAKFNKIAFGTNVKDSEYSCIDTTEFQFNGLASEEAIKSFMDMIYEILNKGPLGIFVDHIKDMHGQDDLNVAFRKSMEQYMKEISKYLK